MERANKTIISIPLLTVGFVFLSLASFLWPALAGFWRYDRQAVLGGEVWRILTAPLTHLSMSHLSWNLLAFFVFGSMLEKISRREFLLICGLTAVASGAVCLSCHPSLMYYSGASGLISGIVAYLSLLKWFTRDPHRSLWGVILFLLAVKVILEIVTQSSLFAIIDKDRVQLLSSSHISGVVVAAGLCFLWRRNHNTA